MSEYSNVTPYAAAKITNIVLQNEDLDKEIKPQMLYTYAKKNIIETTTDENGKIFFVGESFKNWLDRYVEKIRSGEKNERVNYADLADQFIS